HKMFLKVMFYCKLMYQNENLFTMRLILPQIYWISKKVLGCFDALNQAFKSVFNLIGIWF
ncbi:hypothetical protein, partial [Helicobacter pylori]